MCNSVMWVSISFFLVDLWLTDMAGWWNSGWWHHMLPKSWSSIPAIDDSYCGWIFQVKNGFLQTAVLLLFGFMHFRVGSSLIDVILHSTTRTCPLIQDSLWLWTSGWLTLRQEKIFTMLWWNVYWNESGKEKKKLSDSARDRTGDLECVRLTW